MKQYKENPQHFTVQYQRTRAPRSISPMIEQNILKELAIEKKIIQNTEVPLTSYNYSYLRDRLRGIPIIRKSPCPRSLTEPKSMGFTSRNQKELSMTEKS